MQMEVVDLSTPEPGSTADLRDRLQRAERELTALRDDRATEDHEHLRLAGKVSGIKLALSYIHDGERMAAPAQPALVVTPAFVQRFENEYRWMNREEAKPPGKRDPMQAVRVYAVASVLADLLRASGVQGVPDGEPGSVLVALRDLLGMRDGQSFADEG